MLGDEWKRVENEKGYLLIESLVGLLLLAVVSYSLLSTLPLLMQANHRLDKEQVIYQTLFELHDRGLERSLRVTEPFVFDVFWRGDELCARYEWREQGERTICL